MQQLCVFYADFIKRVKTFIILSLCCISGAPADESECHAFAVGPKVSKQLLPKDDLQLPDSLLLCVYSMASMNHGDKHVTRVLPSPD